MDAMRTLISKRWILTTILCVMAVGVMIRLGIWQLDRLEQRREFNARVLTQMNQPVLNLNQAFSTENLAEMEYRKVHARGVYDFANQVVIRNQVWNNRSGVHLLTPLRLDGTDNVVMVDRGWIPLEDISPENWDKYDEPGLVNIDGVIRLSQSKPDFGSRGDELPADGSALTAWNLVNLELMSEQLPYPILKIYIQQYPEGDDETLPIRSVTEVEITEGPHMGYALQWFTFATILFLGYPVYVKREMALKKRNTSHSNVSKEGLDV